MTLGSRGIVLLSGLLTTVMTAALPLYRPTVLARFDNQAHDAMVHALPKRPPSGRVVVVGIDDRSLSEVGQWPWSRTVIARLLARLQELGASTIALDMMFAEPDRQDAPDQATDAALAEAIRNERVVLGYAMTFGAPAGPLGHCVLHPLNLVISRPGAEPADAPFVRATGAVCSRREIAEAAAASGFLNAVPDADGLLRRLPLLIEFDGRVHPGLAVAAVAADLGARQFALRLAHANSVRLAFDGRDAPLDGGSHALLRYRGGSRTFPHVPAADVLAGRVGADAFRNTIVFIGTTALGTRDEVSTPLDTRFTGVEVQATLADNLLQQDLHYRPEHATLLETLAVLLLGIVAALMVAGPGLAWGGPGVLVMLAGVWVAAASLLSSTGALLSPLYPTIGLAAALAVMTVAWFATERRRADLAGIGKAASQQLMIQSLLSLTEVRDAETGRHSRRTQQYARTLAEQFATLPRYRDDLTPERIALLSSLAPLHDIGKVGVPDRLLHKAGALAPEELQEMRRHPVYGREVLERAERRAGVYDDAIVTMAKDIVYTHHEKWDGTGYPEGLRGAEIPVAGRIMALVDAYDALRTRRVYREPMSHAAATACILEGKGTHFDPDVVEAFLQVSRVLEELSTDAEREAGAPAAP